MIGSSGEPKQVCIVNRPAISRQGMLLFIMRMLYIRLKYVEFRLHRDRRHHHKWSISVQTVPIIGLQGKINKEDTGNMHRRNSVPSI